MGLYKEELEKKKKQGRILSNRLIQAETFYSERPFFYDKTNTFWLWNLEEKYYERVDEIDILNKIDEDLEQDIINSTIRTEIINSLKQVGRKHIPKKTPITWVQFKDKIIDIKDDELKIIEPDKDYFIVNSTPYSIGETEETPIMDKIFEEWVEKENKPILYEIIAFCLLQSYFIHRIFCFVGSGSNGKSKYLNLLKKFIGENNCTSTELDLLLNSHFESAKLYKKLVCFMGETNFNTLNKTSTIKRLTGQDLIGFELKNKNPFEELNYAKILIATNTLPMTLDKTEGFYRRWTIIDFANKFNETKDILGDIPEIEYNNLAKKCIRILKELWVKREFTNEGSFEEKVNKYEEKSNPLKLFLKLNFEKEVNGRITFTDFYELYKGFLGERGYRISNIIEVSKGLQNEGYEKKKSSFLNENKEKMNATFIYGLILKNMNTTTTNNTTDIPKFIYI